MAETVDLLHFVKRTWARRLLRRSLCPLSTRRIRKETRNREFAKVNLLRSAALASPTKLGVQIAPAPGSDVIQTTSIATQNNDLQTELRSRDVPKTHVGENKLELGDARRTKKRCASFARVRERLPGGSCTTARLHSGTDTLEGEAPQNG